jgi:nucleoside-diphosphate-sugar epimerase
MNGPAPDVELLGARGAAGLAIGRRLGGALRVRGWSGAPGERSYAAFAASWRERPEEERRCAVVVAAGRSGGAAAALVADHVTRVAELADLWDATSWPSRVVLLGSAAELLPLSAYGAAKRAQRDVAETAARRAGAKLATLRLHSLVPDAPPTRGLLAEIHAGFASGGPVKVLHLNGLRDYVSEEQTAIAVRAALAAPEESLPSLVDVGTGRGLRVGDWLDGFRAAWGASPEVRVARPDTPDPEIVADAGPVRALARAAGADALARWDAAAPVPSVCAARWRRP